MRTLVIGTSDSKKKKINKTIGAACWSQLVFSSLRAHTGRKVVNFCVAYTKRGTFGFICLSTRNRAPVTWSSKVVSHTCTHCRPTFKDYLV